MALKQEVDAIYSGPEAEDTNMKLNVGKFPRVKLMDMQTRYTGPGAFANHESTSMCNLSIDMSNGTSLHIYILLCWR